MSATPPPNLASDPMLVGFFTKNGSPAIRIRISGPVGDRLEFEAVIDTGFTGFLSIPMVKAFPLGLPLFGTTAITFADGSSQTRLTGAARITVGSDSNVGTAILEWSSNEILIGMAFLRLFKKALFVSKDFVVLVDEDYLAKATSNALGTATQN